MRHVFFIVCVALCCVFFEHGVLSCVICVFMCCNSPFAVLINKFNNNKNHNNNNNNNNNNNVTCF
jgi:hypothetical protein